MASSVAINLALASGKKRGSSSTTRGSRVSSLGNSRLNSQRSQSSCQLLVSEDIDECQSGKDPPLIEKKRLRRLPSQNKIIPTTQFHSSPSVLEFDESRSRSNSSVAPRHIGRVGAFVTKTQKHLPSYLFMKKLHAKQENGPTLVHQHAETINRVKIMLRVPPYIIQPDSKFLYRWDILLFVLLVYTAIITPYEMAFYPMNAWPLLAIDCFINAVFLLDVVVNFFCSFYQRDKFMHREHVTNLRKIARRYIRRHFLVDFLSALPVMMVPVLLNKNIHGNLSYLKSVRFIRLGQGFRLLRLVKAGKMFTKLEKYIHIDYATEALTKYGFLVLIVGHWLACLWGGIANIQDHKTDSWIANFCPSWECDPNSLLDIHFELYTASLYFSIMTITSIGYGNITPVSLLEHWVCVFMMLLGASVWAYTIGNASSIIATMGSDMVEYNRLMDNLRGLVKANNYPPEVKKELYQYFKAYKSMIRKQVNSEVINHMSPQLQHYIIQWNTEWMKKVKWMRVLTPELVTEMLNKMETMLYCPGETMPSSRTLCKMNSGVGSRFGRVMVKGGVWGSDMILSSDLMMRKTKVKAVTYCEVMQITRDDFFMILDGCPAQIREIRKWAAFITLRRALRLIGIASKQNWVIDKSVPKLRMRLTSNNLSADELAHYNSVVFKFRSSTNAADIQKQKSVRSTETDPVECLSDRTTRRNATCKHHHAEHTGRRSSWAPAHTTHKKIVQRFIPEKPPLPNVWATPGNKKEDMFFSSNIPGRRNNQTSSEASDVSLIDSGPFEMQVTKDMNDLRELAKQNQQELKEIKQLICHLRMK